MTLCNMVIEGGARAGLVGPDETTFAYVRGRRYAPADSEFDRYVEAWKALNTDEGATYDRVIQFDVSDLEPQVTWGTNPAMCVGVNGTVPDPSQYDNEVKRKAVEQALQYMGLKPGTPIQDIEIHHVFIGSCTNSRIEDLRVAAEVVRDRKVAPGVRALVVPGSKRVKEQAEAEGLHEVFKSAGFEWRESGCSMCLAMIPTPCPQVSVAHPRRIGTSRADRVEARTHLVSPAMAAAAAIAGRFVDVRKLMTSYQTS